MVKILGISPWHDSSVAVYSDKGIEFYCKEERVTGVKRKKNPIKSIELAIEQHPDITEVVIASPGSSGPENEFIRLIVDSKLDCPIVDLSAEHHLQHASLAFYNSGFDRALVFVVDRNGSYIANGLARESESVFEASYPHDFKSLTKNYWVKHLGEDTSPSIDAEAQVIAKDKGCVINARSAFSIVKVYETATSLIGQGHLENGKTMGLASYGEPRLDIPLFIDGYHPIDYHFSHAFKEFAGKMPMAISRELDPFAVTEVTEDNFKPLADYAYHVQQETQQAVLSLIREHVDKTGIKKVCLTGGYALNIVANEFVAKNMPDVEFYVEPLADDSGNSIGAAMYLYRLRTGDETIKPLRHTFINGTNHDLSLVHGNTVSVEEIVDLLINQKSVAVYQGLAEAGPRALGNRSILFDPTNPNAKDIVNLIKHREWYRPFAAMVLKEDAQEYFEMAHIKDCPFMTMSFPVKEDMKSKIPGVTHVDGSCRIQTVDEADGVIYNVLKEFKARTGVSVLLNTSFNLSGKPLVETVDDAVYTLECSSLDYVWFPEIGKILTKGESYGSE